MAAAAATQIVTTLIAEPATELASITNVSSGCSGVSQWFAGKAGTKRLIATPAGRVIRSVNAAPSFDQMLTVVLPWTTCGAAGANNGATPEVNWWLREKVATAAYTALPSTKHSESAAVLCPSRKPRSTSAASCTIPRMSARS